MNVLLFTFPTERFVQETDYKHEEKIFYKRKFKFWNAKISTDNLGLGIIDM